LRPYAGFNVFSFLLFGPKIIFNLKKNSFLFLRKILSQKVTMIGNIGLLKKFLIAVGVSHLIFYLLFFPQSPQKESLLKKGNSIGRSSTLISIPWSSSLLADGFPVPKTGSKIKIYNKNYQLIFDLATVGASPQNEEEKNDEFKELLTFIVPIAKLQKNLSTEISRTKFFNTPWYLAPYFKEPSIKKKRIKQFTKLEGLNDYAVEFYWKAF
jgi:hypothetical protein